MDGASLFAELPSASALPEDGTASSPTVDLPPRKTRQRRHVLPGFGLTLGFTIFYLTLIVLLPLLALTLKTVVPSTADYPTFARTVAHVWAVTTDARALNSYKLSFGIAACAALLNGVFGFIVAWSLSRYAFFGRRIVDALVDLPFAMPTSVAGLALAQIFSTHAYLGQYLYDDFGWRVDSTAWGILIAQTFVGFPFVVRTLQPVIAQLPAELEEAAACLGANRWKTFIRVILPAVRPALLAGVMLAFGRAVGEYGSIVFIYGTMPFKEIAPQLIINKLEEYDYTGAAGIGLVMLLIALAIVVTVNLGQHFASRRRPA
jgi:sulfate transport system permease protein